MRVRSFVIGTTMYCIVSNSGRNPFFSQHVNAWCHNDLRATVNHMVLYLLDVNPTTFDDITQELKKWFEGYFSLDTGVHMLSVRIDRNYWMVDGLKLEDKIVLSKGEGQYSLDVGVLASSIQTESKFGRTHPIRHSQLEIMPLQLPF